MSKRIIINNDSTLADMDAMVRVYSVIGRGLISVGPNGNQYCFATVFNDCEVFCKLNKAGTHTFVIRNVKE